VTGAQPQRRKDCCHLTAQRLGIGLGAVDHDDEVVGVADQPPRAQTLAPSRLAVLGVPASPLLLEVLIQHRQGDVGQQR